ncbi:hypothetical protein IscW_ISCW002185 [Ixodes scapularis]|uniref:Uncharacterized protein n=1 Tax=Ixodes scapularis TaxID=6945 RepID=B7PBQ7_IXOSC|nr:hypothetical protein IscW_ISCW002185 [Ixodes scapularis]|eukprot:XP_002408758.1 hypothetical protein IscW_ISCW002185 [Ixodes scapularis]
MFFFPWGFFYSPIEGWNADCARVLAKALYLDRLFFFFLFSFPSFFFFFFLYDMCISRCFVRTQYKSCIQTNDVRVLTAISSSRCYEEAPSTLRLEIAPEKERNTHTHIQ